MLFLTPRHPSGFPSFAALDFDNAPDNPCEFVLLGSVLPPPLLEPLFPHTGLDLKLVPDNTKEGRASSPGILS